MGRAAFFVCAFNDPTIPKGAQFKPSRPPNMRDEWEAHPTNGPMGRMGYLDVEDEDTPVSICIVTT